MAGHKLGGDWSQQIRYADGLTADSHPVIEELLTIKGCEKKPAMIFRFGISEPAFRPAPQSLELKRKLNLPEDCKLVYSPRSLRDNYNHETLVHAIPSVLECSPNTYFLFVNNHGHRYPDSVEYINKLVTDINNLGISEHIRFLDHHPDHSQVATLFQTSDVVVSIPKIDAFPATIFEAMACGAPLVVSDLRDYDGVVDESNAIRISPMDSFALSVALKKLLTDDVLHAKFRSAGLRTVAEKGNMEREVDNLLDFYQNLILEKKQEI
jgi:glycosyltransferase involved in cell wall biosynthesis